MKTLRIIFQASVIYIFTMANYSEIQAQAQTGVETGGIQKLLDSKRFTFVAQSVTPQRGGFRQLTSRYDLKITPDSLISNLPYYGRAYSAPIDPSSGGINFTSTSFDYTSKVRKKGGWDVIVKPKDGKDVQQMFLSVFENGSATLQVTSNNRQPISFNGNVN